MEQRVKNKKKKTNHIDETFNTWLHLYELNFIFNNRRNAMKQTVFQHVNSIDGIGHNKHTK